MIDIKNCPSTLQEGFDTYSPKASKLRFRTNKISPMLDFNIDEFRNVGEIIEAMHRISVSGVQEKFPAIIDNGKIRIAQDGERSTHILKPAPWDKTFRDRKQIPANEHLTMQIASQVYGIHTASNGLCFTPDGQAVYITRRFDILSDGIKMPMEDFASLVGKNEQVSGHSSNIMAVMRILQRQSASMLPRGWWIWSDSLHLLCSTTSTPTVTHTSKTSR